MSTDTRKGTWYEQATAIQGYSPEDYWYTVLGYIEERRFNATIHRMEFGSGEAQPNFPSVDELQSSGLDIEIFARQLWDGIDAALFGKALAAEKHASRLNTVLKIGTVAEVNRWMGEVVARAEKAAAPAAAA